MLYVICYIYVYNNVIYSFEANTHTHTHTHTHPFGKRHKFVIEILFFKDEIPPKKYKEMQMNINEALPSHSYFIPWFLIILSPHFLLSLPPTLSASSQAVPLPTDRMIHPQVTVQTGQASRIP